MRPRLIWKLASTGRKVLSAAWLTAGMTGLRRDDVLAMPSMGTGRRRPVASGSPSLLRTNLTPLMLPSSSPMISTGLTRNSMRHALALGLAQLLLVHDELRAGAPVGDGHVLGAVAEAGPRAVHGRVAAADDDHVLADLELLAEVGLLHEVDAVLDALEVVAGDVERHRVHGARADGDRVELLVQLLEGDVAADAGVEVEGHAEALDELVVHLDGFARQAEGGHADEHACRRPWAARRRR